MKFRLNTLIYVFMIALFCFSGCGSIQTVSPSHGRKKNYEIKTSYTTVAGKPMLSVYNTDIFPAYKAKYTYQPPYIYIRGDKLCEQMPLITPEQKWRILYRRAKGNYVIYSDNYNKLAGTEKTPIGIEITPDGKLANEEAWVHTHTPVQTAVQALWDVPKPQLFEKTEDYVKEGSFKAELIYIGKKDNKITLYYSEPATFQELQYDLSKGQIIKFKSLKIKIAKATKTDITFEVIDDGTLSWVPKRGLDRFRSH
jgi:hypothetical protein